LGALAFGPLFVFFLPITNLNQTKPRPFGGFFFYLSHCLYISNFTRSQLHNESYTNISAYLQTGASTNKLPVVVYVHGGAFNTGHGSDRNLAHFVAFSGKPILAVGFNYRLGPLGFLPSSVTAREGLLNLGLRDQQLLFRWVKENIAAFGGDGDNITLMGISAGAHSVCNFAQLVCLRSTQRPRNQVYSRRERQKKKIIKGTNPIP
jgi:acetyl esterase/lipase